MHHSSPRDSILTKKIVFTNPKESRFFGVYFFVQMAVCCEFVVSWKIPLKNVDIGTIVWYIEVKKKVSNVKHLHIILLKKVSYMKCLIYNILYEYPTDLSRKTWLNIPRVTARISFTSIDLREWRDLNLEYHSPVWISANDGI